MIEEYCVGTKNKNSARFDRKAPKCILSIKIILFASFFSTLSISLPSRADEKQHLIYGKLHTFSHICNQNCSIAFYGGRSTSTDSFKVFGLKGYEAPWDWHWNKVYIAAIAVSRRLATFGIRGLGDAVDIEVESGFGQRFGDLRESEVWAAIYARWTNFPWNHLIYTTIGASTGFSYATGAPALERRMSDGRGSRLMHFFSPEITFALPRKKNFEFLIRYHHRSGLFKNPLFHYTTGGLNFITAGFRIRF